MSLIRIGLFLAVLLAPGSFCLGDVFEPKADCRIVCLDLQTGKLVWEHVPDVLSDAHFEWCKQGVVAYPHSSGNDRRHPIFLDAQSGNSVAAFPREPEDILAHSAVFSPGPELKLANGWRLHGFSAGNSKTLVFRDERDREAWQIATGGYPHEVRSWKDFVFYASSYKEGILYAYRAGAKQPTWTLDLNTIVTGRNEPLTRMIFQVIEDKIYIEANEHIFCIDPESGKLLWHRDVAQDLHLSYRPDLFDGAMNLAVFAKSGDVLVMSFEKRVIALNLKTGKYLWHLMPDTFPQCPFPVVLGGRVILTAGAKRRLTQLTTD